MLSSTGSLRRGFFTEVVGGCSDGGQSFKSLPQNEGFVESSSDPGLRSVPVCSQAQQGKGVEVEREIENEHWQQGFKNWRSALQGRTTLPFLVP